MEINQKPKVAVIIVTWNNENEITACLDSIKKTTYSNTESIIVVDNASSDKTVEIIENSYPWVELIKSEKNTFFTGGNNIGIKHALEKYDLEYVILLNPDTRVEADWIDRMVEVAISDQSIGIIGPKIKFWNNKFEGKINSAGMIYDGFMQAYDRGVEEEDNGQYDKIEEIEAVSGTCLLLKVEMLNEIGLLWERLRMYIEEVELAIRARKKGWKVIYAPVTEIGHQWMKSTNQSNTVRRKGWMMRNWVLIALRHYSWKSKLAMVKEWVRFRFLK